MKIAFACDHGGFSLRDEILEYLAKSGHEVLDFGAYESIILDDFPDYAEQVSRALIEKKAERGVLICGTGIGMSIAANRHTGIRAVLAYNPEIAKISRSHNDANIICFGARTMQSETVISSLESFLAENFIGGKYQRRNEKLDCSC
ncbi:ribose 5-phosphate isomerase B [Candidatus Gracilibacteria bacterium]|nr:ribose 5-phosphate isomerase B [Candidatus Gracilibacteria bacterium]